jgi:hypothetical protein
MSELERTKAVLEFTRDHNRKLVEENARLRAGLPVPEPTQAMIRLQEQLTYMQQRCSQLETEIQKLRQYEPITVKVHPDLMPPPPKARHQERRVRISAYAGEKPLRTLWPLED